MTKLAHPIDVQFVQSVVWQSLQRFQLMPAREQATPSIDQQLHVLLPGFFLQHCLACSC
jgi:hypothetical protein